MRSVITSCALLSGDQYSEHLDYYADRRILILIGLAIANY
jgi:hypothetical protein